MTSNRPAGVTPTITHVAEAAGVSIKTVSRVINQERLAERSAYNGRLVSSTLLDAVTTRSQDTAKFKLRLCAELRS
jgi:hypothetical protein